MNLIRAACAVAFACLGLTIPAFATTPLGYVAVSASHLTDSTGTVVANATISFQPANNSGVPISYKVNGLGQATMRPVTTLVTAGAFSIQLADTALTLAPNVCFVVSVTDNVTGKHLLGPGYSCVQPAGSGPAVTGSFAWCSAATLTVGGSCNFDTYTPNMVALNLTSPVGPQGPQGNPGVTGATGAQGPAASSIPVTSTGSISVVQEWSYQMPAGGQTYSTPILTTDQGIPAIAFQGIDWYFYVLQASNGTLMWRKAFGDQNYGRAQAWDVDGSGNTTFFGASHDGQIHSLNYLGANNWQVNNSFTREGTGTVTSATSTVITDATQNWAVGEFLSPRIEGPTYGAVFTITSGTGVGETGTVASVSAHAVTLTAPLATVPNTTSHYAITPLYSSDIDYQHAGTLSLEGLTWYLYCVGFDGEVLKLNAVTGAIVWKYEVSENMEPFPLVMNVTGNVTSGWRDIVVESVNGYVYALNYLTGAVEWSVMPEQVSGTNQLDGYIEAADINNSGTIQVLVGCRSSHFFVINGTTGVVMAITAGNYGDTYAGVDNGAAITPPVGGYSTFTYADHAGFVVNSNYLGQTQWKAYYGVTINSSIQIGDVFNNGGVELVIVDMSGTVTIANPTTGVPYGQINIQGGGEGTALIGHIVDGQNEIVVTTVDGYVQCYKVTFI